MYKTYAMRVRLRSVQIGESLATVSALFGCDRLLILSSATLLQNVTDTMYRTSRFLGIGTVGPWERPMPPMPHHNVKRATSMSTRKLSSMDKQPCSTIRGLRGLFWVDQAALAVLAGSVGTPEH